MIHRTLQQAFFFGIKKETVFLFLAFILVTETNSQCDGNLGENIFTDGNFGSGASNVLQINPQIAPGYNYITNPPPTDGSYTITNNTSPWGSFASTWADIGDNSNDPNGYMMVVNASYEPGLFYEQEVTGLCENTLYVFSADVYNLMLSAAIRPNISFLLDGVVFYETGNIPETQTWNTYGFTFSTAPGQTAITLALQNNAPGGGGNDLALDNITFRPCGPQALILPEAVANICEDGTPIDLEATVIGDQYENPVYQWQQSFDEGITWEDIPGADMPTHPHTDLSAGFYYYRYLLAAEAANLQNTKCRIISNVKVVHVVPKFYTIIDTLCSGLLYQSGNNSYSETGIYTDSLLTVTGCDSIVVTNLTFLEDVTIDAAFTITDTSCKQFKDGSITLDNIYNGAAPYTIAIDSINSLTGNIFDLPEGTYHYQITDKYGCTFEETIAVQGGQSFTVELGPDRQLELGASVQLNPVYSGPVESYSWQTSDSIICTTACPNLNLTPGNTTMLYLTAISPTGCPASDSILITITTVRKVYIPNIFSPDYDGFNDYFTIFGAMPNIQNIEELLVFNRWGGLVFQAKDFLPNAPLSGWDGTTKGRAAPEGVYTYFTKIRFLDENVVVYKGDVLLVR